MALVSPFLVLGVAELILRGIGAGHPIEFLVPARLHGESQLVDNPHFGRRFFPGGMLRQPPPMVVAREKAPGTIRIVVLGESAAMGDPQPAFGVSRYLEVLLNERYPAVRFEVVPIAMTAINSHALLPMARVARALSADYWIVFAGNNEMLGPFAASSALGQQGLPLPLVRASLAAKGTRLGQILDGWLQHRRGTAVGSTRWTGLRLFAEQNIPEGSPERSRVYDAFEDNLRRLVRLGQKSGARVLLGSVAVNLRDCAPFGVRRGPAPPEWDALVREGKEHLDHNDAEKALSPLQRADAIDPKDATLQFLLGKTELARSNRAAALDRFIRARDLDTVPLRTDSKLNAVTQAVAREMGVRWVDHADSLAQASPEGIPGSEFFYEHAHLTPEGNYVLARSFADGLVPELSEAVTRKAQPHWGSRAYCDAQLALSSWNRQDGLMIMARRCSEPPFTQQTDHPANLQSLKRQVAVWSSQQTHPAAAEARILFNQAIEKAPLDHHYCRSYAEFLDAIGDVNAAIVQWRRLAEILPHHFRGWYQAGTDLTRAGRAAEAIPLLQQVIRLQVDWPDGYVALGQALLQNRDSQGALAQFDTALRLDPALPLAHRHRADALARLGRRSEGLACLEEAVRLDPNFVEARYLLGVEYASLNRIAEAREQLAEVTRLQPNHVRAHFNLGVALARETRWVQAEAAFQQTLRLDPAHVEAKRMLSKIAALQSRAGSIQAPAAEDSAATRR